MEGGRDESAWRRALEMGDIVGNILHRTGSSLSMIRCKGVCPAWRDAATAPGFIDEFCKKTEQANVGYIVQFGEGHDKRTSLLYSLTSEGHETADYMRGKVGVEALRQEDVLACVDGLVLTACGAGGGSPEQYHTSCLWLNERLYKPEATHLLKILVFGNKRTINTYGQFGFLPDIGTSGMSFFIKEPAGRGFSTYDGVSFCSSANVFVHVNVYNGVGWDTTDSGPIVSDGEALFHHNPYCVLDGNYLYMMYLVKYIICFKLDSKGFSGILLPGELGQTVTSCNQYTVAPRTGGA